MSGIDLSDCGGDGIAGLKDESRVCCTGSAYLCGMNVAQALRDVKE